MKTKFSKRVLSFFLSVLMILTSIPMAALTASAQDVSVTSAVADWNFTQSFADFGGNNGGIYGSTSPVSDSISGLGAMKAYNKADATWKYQDGGAYSREGYLYAENLGQAFAGASKIKISASLSFTENKDHDYGLISIGTGENVDFSGNTNGESGFWGILNIHKNGGVYYDGQWWTSAEIGDLQTGVRYDIDVVLEGNDLDLYVNGTKYDITADCRFSPASFNFLALGVNGHHNFPAMVVYDVRAYATKTVSVNNDIASLEAAISTYENILSSGAVFTNMTPAYNAFLAAARALDACKYGGKTGIDYSTLAQNLYTEISNMGTFRGYTGTAVEKFMTNDVSSSLYNNLLSFTDDWRRNSYAETNRGGETSGYAYFSGGSDSRMQFKNILPLNVTLLYDGIHESYFAHKVEQGWNKGGNKARVFNYIENANNGFEYREHWKGDRTRYDLWNDNPTAYTVSYSSTINQTCTFGRKDQDTTFFINKLYVKKDINPDLFTDCKYVVTQPKINVLWANDTGGILRNDDGAVITVINYKALIDAVNNRTAEITSANYKEGGLRNLFTAIDAATSYNPNGDAGNTVGAKANAVKTALVVADISSPNGYQDIRNALLNPTYTECLANESALYTADSWARFVSAMDAAKKAMRDVYDDNGYGLASVDAANLAGNIETQYRDLVKKANVTQSPEITGQTILGPADEITIATAEEGATVSYAIGDGAYVSADSNTVTIAPFADSQPDTVMVKAKAVKDGVESAQVTETYTYYKAPAFSVQNAARVIEGAAVTITTGLPSANGTIQYSTDGENWAAGTSIVPFPAGSSNVVANLYAREVKNGSTSEDTTITVIKADAFAIIAKNGDEISTSIFNGDSTFYLYNTNINYTDTIYYSVAVDGGTPSAITTYNHATGIPAAAYKDANVVEITAYARSNGELQVIKSAFVKEGFETLVYHESFDGASINGNTFTTGSDNKKGLNGTFASNRGAQVLSGYAVGGFDGNGNSADYRQNVIYQPYGGRNPLVFDSNPLSSTEAKIVSGTNGVTISFWRAFDRAIDYKENATIKDEEIDWKQWTQALCFGKDDSYNGNTGRYYYLEVCGTARSSFNNGDGAGSAGNFVDIYPDKQDRTLHAAGNSTASWVHIAVTIDPNKGVTVYTNGVPHETRINSAGKDYADMAGQNCGDYVNSPALAKEIIEFLTDNTTSLKLFTGDSANSIFADTYLDDIRIYADSLTQVEINNMYADGKLSDFPEAYSNASLGHDPTAVTVYTLAGGTYTSVDGKNKTITEPAGKTVGQEFIDYYGISATDKSKVTAVDYYIFGTGMTIYHSSDNVNWETVGDSEGRCGYQNQQLYGGVYTEAIAEQLAFASNHEAHALPGAGYLQWAPHVMYNLNADCWQYYGSTSSWNSHDSCIFTGNAQNIVGPYQEIKTVFASCASYTGSSTPANAIDACVYYGHNADGSINPNEMYMLYGSWNPTYVIKLDPTTGQNVNYNPADPYGTNYGGNEISDGYYYYGKMICAGNTEIDQENSGEGGFMIYQYPYYYFYISLGSNHGNYQLRMYRSTEADRGFTMVTGEQATDTTKGTRHGMSYLSSYYLPIYDYVYTSVGHNSAYKAVNLNDKIVTVDSTHARTYSTTAKGAENAAAMQDGDLITRQIEFPGNISIQNMLAYTKDGWQVAFPLQYNGTDSTVCSTRSNGRFTAKDIEGIYTFNNLMMSAVPNYARPYTLTIKATGATTAAVYTDNYMQNLTLSYGTDYAGDPITYLTLTGINEDAGKTYQGVFAEQIIDGKVVTEFSWFQNDSAMHVWGYRSETLPEDMESAGDIIRHSKIIYTHKENGSYDLYGREISDNFKYGTTGTSDSSGERYTTITSTYPYYIDTNSQTAIYSLSSEKYSALGYKGANFRAVDINGYWVGSDGNHYTDEEAAAAYSNPNNSIVFKKTYGLTGLVSEYFHYHTGSDCQYGDGSVNRPTGYPETGVSLLINYQSMENPGTTYGEYEYFYVMPNPNWAHEVLGVRNQQQNFFADNNHKFDTSLYSRFIDSEGSASDVRNVRDNDNTSFAFGNGTVEKSQYDEGVGNFKYVYTWGTQEAISQDYTKPASFYEHFNFYNPTDGVTSGSYVCNEHNNTTINTSYAVGTSVVNVDYYVDYSDSDEYGNLITVDGSNTPTGYTFELRNSNIKWSSIKKENNATSFALNRTGMNTSYASSFADGVRTITTDTGTDHLDIGNQGVFNGLKNSLERGFTTLVYNTDNPETNSWTGTVTFTGRNTVKHYTDTSDALSYSNYILEVGGYTERGISEETYQYYNIGVSTCDKGAVRDFLTKYANKDMIKVYDENHKLYLIPGNGIVSSNYSLASYNNYLEALEEAYYFLENPHNTTYNGDTYATAAATNGINGDHEYTTAYRTESKSIECKDDAGNKYTIERPAGTAIYNSDDLGGGDDIFGTGTTNTDPVQTRIIDNIVEAYLDLFDKEDYDKAAEAMAGIIGEKTDIDAETGKLVITDTSNYTAESIAQFEQAANLASEYIGYDQVLDPHNRYNYWRYTDLTADEYSDLQNYLTETSAALMPVVDTSDLGATIDSKTAVLGSGINDGTKEYTISSWLDLNDEINTAADLKTTEDAARNERYQYGADKTADVLDTEYTYHTPYDKNVLSQYQIAVNDENDTLAAKNLAEVDTAEAYQSFNSAYAIVTSADLNKYTDEARAQLEAKLNELKNEKVYITPSDAQKALYSEKTGNALTGDQYKRTALTETDTYTAELLNFINGLAIKQFKKTFTIVSVDGTTNTTEEIKSYGDIFSFDAGSVNNDEYVTWSVTTYAGTADNVGDALSSNKLSSVLDNKFEHIADANMVITARIQKGEGSAANTVKVYDVYNRLVGIYYTDTALGTLYNQINENTSATISVGSTNVTAAEVPFYNFSQWNAYNIDGMLHVYPNYTPNGTYTLEVTGGKFTSTTVDGVLSSADATSLSGVMYDTLVTVEATEPNFYAWAVDNDNGTYQIASYSDTYSFYAAANEKYVPVTVDGDVYCINGTPITYNMLDSTTGFDFDSITTLTPNQFVQAKLAAKAPFIACQNTAIITDKGVVKNRAYLRVTEGADRNACSVYVQVGDNLKKAAVSNILQTGQFVVTLKAASGTMVKASVSYNFDYTAHKTSSSMADVTKTINAEDFASIA